MVVSLLKKNHFHFFDLVAIFLCIIFVIAGIAVSLNRFWQYEVFFYDFGIFDQAIWKVSRLQAPIIDHFVVGGKWIFADHFSPGIFLLTPLYWITDRSEILLIAQVIIVGLSGLVLYDIGREILRNRFQAVSILVCYFLFVGLQNAIISDFHEVTVMTFPLMLTFWAFVKKKRLLYVVFLILTLSFKESTFLLGVGIGTTIFFIRREWLRMAFLTVAVSFIWGFLSIKVIIPYFSGGFYQYGFGLFEQGSDIFFTFFDHPIKQQTLLYSFLSFGFLPFLIPSFWFVIFQDFLTRFAPESLTRWGLGLHYSAQLAPLLAIASIYAIKILVKKLSRTLVSIFTVLLIVNAIILYRFILHGPLGLAYNPDFYKHTKNFVYLDKLFKTIPNNILVMTQNNLAVRFTHKNVLLLRDDYIRYKPDYIMIDARGGQNPNNFFGITNIYETIRKLKTDQNYESIYETKEQFIFKKRT